MTPGQNISQECQKLEPLLDDYLHGELPRATAEQLAAHLAACGDCRGALDDLRVSTKLVGSAFEQSSDPGPGFARMVMARIHTAEHWLQGQRSFWRPFEVIAWRLAFSAALALAFLFAYGIRTSSQAVLAPTATLSPAQHDVFAVPVSAVPSNNDEVLMAIAEHHHER